MKKTTYALALVLLAVSALNLVGCTPNASAPEGALVSVKADANPILDGVADEAAWQAAPEAYIPVASGANESETKVRIKSVYTDDTVYFVAKWEDPTHSFMRSPWEKQADGSWKVLKDPADKGGDNNLWYEDKLAIIWPINNSIPEFSEKGCDLACHKGENPDIKPYGNKYTAAASQTGDIWHWKSVRNVGQVDDQYLDSAKLESADPTKTRDAGRHSDPDTGGGYKDNKTADGKLPGFMLPASATKDGSPGFILDSEKVAFDNTTFVAGDRIPGIVVSEFKGDRADIPAKWKWADGEWTLEFSRKLKTGSQYDVQFDDLAATYYFGTAIFDNAQVRHAFQRGSTPFVFKP
jgi:hypothetical protein